ncbi:thiamine pyrophosphate-dependent enzyme [Aetokthonos hydrillicola]|uniref:thiamine pyrophosphate-dependent enzyme n=1 Tax=Aetokthonos hydrillicola TaxID=1550245 RepID=UPI001ABB733C
METESFPVNKKNKIQKLGSDSYLIPSPVADVQLNLEPLDLTPSQKITAASVAEAVVKMLEDLGVEYAFGVSGGAIAPLWHALQHSSIKVLHFRHEAGAAFAATEAYFASDRPVVVFTTTGPGITNALTGLFAAVWEGAKVIFLSASTSTGQRGRWACQETSTYTMPEGIFSSGSLFDYATTLESSDELPVIYRRLAGGLTRPGGFVTHLSIPTAIQTSPLKISLSREIISTAPVNASETNISEWKRLLFERTFAIWVGFGARFAAEEIRELAERTGAAVMCSPRGKGIFPENHPQFVGVTGFGGHESVVKYMQQHRPLRTLVLGTRLGERSSLWKPVMVPRRGFLHVDLDPEVPGTAYPSAETFAIQSEIKLFVMGLLKYFSPKHLNLTMKQVLPQPEQNVININPRTNRSVRPAVLMGAIQQVIVEGSNALVMTEASSASAWGNYMLQFTKPNRYRNCSGFSSMGQITTGVVGAALARNSKVVAIVGDGAMLMNSEVSTAVKYQIPAVWIVLNNGLYNMCVQGTKMQGFKDMDAEIPQTNFVKIAYGMGADGIRVETEADILPALKKAMAAAGPFVVDVLVDATEPIPIKDRIENLIAQNTGKF